MAETTTRPEFTGVVNRDFFIAPLGGPQNPINYLNRFPDGLYNKAIDSHLVKFMYALLGPAGIGWLRKNYLETRLTLEDFGIELFDLDNFYANPLQFGRILEEVYDVDPLGLLPRDKWEEIRAKDAKYRNRAVNYVTGVRAGNTLTGMHLIARSGLGHEVEIIENYRYLYDIHSDDPLGLPYLGKTASTEEMIVLPRREITGNEAQIITISGAPTGGTFTLFFPVGPELTNQTSPIAYNATRANVQAFIDAITSIGPGNTRVTGGPLPANPIRITFVGKLANQNVPQLQASNSLTGGNLPSILVTTDQEGVSDNNEIAYISPRDMRYARDAIDRIKPVTTILSFGNAPGLRTVQVWNEVSTTSTYQEVIRYVVGQTGVNWPARTDQDWIEAGVEHEGRRSLGDLQHHYRGFHNVAATYAYTEGALTSLSYSTDVTSLTSYKSEHIGPFTSFQRVLFPVLNTPLASDFQFTSDRVLADYAEPLTVSSVINQSNGSLRALVNGIYPMEYQNLAGIPSVRYKDDQFWASYERNVGTEYLEIDLGVPQAVNYLIFEATMKPFDISISYDVLDGSPARDYRPVKFRTDIPTTLSLSFNPQSINKWFTVENFFTGADNSLIFTRYIRLGFTRRNDVNSPFANDDGTISPYSIEVRNLRIGRNQS